MAAVDIEMLLILNELTKSTLDTLDVFKISSKMYFANKQTIVSFFHSQKYNDFDQELISKPIDLHKIFVLIILLF